MQMLKTNQYTRNMAQKEIKEKEVVAQKEEEAPKEAAPKKVKRLSNEEIVEKLYALKEEITKERNIRSVKTNVVERENSFQLEGLIRNIHNAVFAFDLFIKPPKAQ